MGNETYSISAASERLGVSYRKLHYYEQKIGLSIMRDSSGNRLYTEADIGVFNKIIELKKSGVTLSGIKTMFEQNNNLPLNEVSDVLVLEEKSLSAKEIIIQEIKGALSDCLKDTNTKLEQLISENNEIKDKVQQLLYNTEDHYCKIDRQLTKWRERERLPWYRKLFFKG